MVLLRLVESHCVPILSYAIEMTDVANRDEKRSLRVAYNSVFRKLFGYRYHECVSSLQRSLQRPTWEELVETRRKGFYQRTRTCADGTLVRLLSHVRGM